MRQATIPIVSSVHPADDRPSHAPSTSRRAPITLGRRRFLAAGAGVTAAAVLAACSSSDEAPTASDVDPTTPPTTASETTTPGSVPPTTTAVAAAASALLAPGSPGLVDEATYQQRVDEYLEFATTAEPLGNPAAINAFLARARRDPDFVWPIGNVTVDSLATTWEPIDAWRDRRNVRLMDLHWMLALGDGGGSRWT